MDRAEGAGGRNWDRLWQGKTCLFLWAAAAAAYGFSLWAGLAFLSPVPFLLLLGLAALAGGAGLGREVRFGPFIALGGVAAYGLEKTGLLSVLTAWLLAG